MSNFLAIATATEGLRRVLQSAIDTADVPGAIATTVRPISNGTSNELPEVGVNAYLHGVSPNAAWRNADLPTRGSDGRLRQRPQAALILHYLLTCYGDERELEPQRLLGSVLRALHAEPLLSPNLLQQIVADASDQANPDPPHPFLAGSDLADQVELVRFTPEMLNLEELSKLWSIFFQTPYTLSVAYQASVVLIESEATLRRALPVRTRGVRAIPLQRPLIQGVSPQIVEPGGTLALIGQNLAGAITVVLFDREIEVEPTTLQSGEVTVEVPDTLRAGIHTVSTRYDVDFGTPVEPHRGYASNLIAFALAPVITTESPIPADADTVLTLGVAPPVGITQDVRLIAGDRAIPAQRDDNPPDPADSVDFHIPADLAPGSYLVRVEVDGVHSMLEVDEEETSPSFGDYIGPLLVVT
jgi:hypothetical protein